MNNNELFELRIEMLEKNYDKFSEKQIKFASSLIYCYYTSGVTKIQYEKFINMIDHQLAPKTNKIYAKFDKNGRE